MSSCEMVSIISREYHIVNMKSENWGCLNAMYFGDSYICKCPTRSEMYFKKS